MIITVARDGEHPEIFGIFSTLEEEPAQLLMLHVCFIMADVLVC